MDEDGKGFSWELLAAAEEEKDGAPVSLFPYSLFPVTDYCYGTER